MATNFVKVDASHYERLVKDSHTLEQIRRVLLNSVEYYPYSDRISFQNTFSLYEDLSIVFDNGTLKDFQIRYAYLREQYKEKEASKNAETENKD